MNLVRPLHSLLPITPIPLFAFLPAISLSGTLMYSPAGGVSGLATITIALMDNGGTANGGADTSAKQSFNIHVLEGGTLAFSSAAYSVTEGVGSAAITIARNAGSAGTATVLFASSNGTATAGDYTSISQTITFNHGEVSKTVIVAITDDLFKELDETINLTLGNAGGSGELGAQTTALLTIVDDDPLGGYIRFSSANFNTTESSGSTSITVERVGDTFRAVTVDYATSDDSGSATVVPCSTVDGIALSRCDFTTALGTLRFAAGESSKTFEVLISQDNYVEGPEALTLTLSKLTGGALFATPSTATLTITDDATEPATNPIDVADSFVRQHYHDFLNREPDAAGLAFWSDQITSCGTDTACFELRRINVSAAFFLSIEFQQTGYLVCRMYSAAYGNVSGTPVPVTLNEFLPDTQQIGLGVVAGRTGWEAVLENSKQGFTADFVARSRFTSIHPTRLTPTEFVNALFANAGVTPSAADLSTAINEFGTATDTTDTAARARSLRRVAENSVLAHQETNKAFVLMQYFGYLRRNPNDAPEPGLNFDGYNFWLGKLNQFNGNFVDAEMVKAFIVSGEYRQRFGP